jgi:hypothetical protein
MGMITIGDQLKTYPESSPMSKITIHHNDIEITIEGPSNHFFGQDLYTEAVVSLIEEADIHGWEKHNLEQGGREDTFAEFCAAILTALTRVYADEAILPSDEQAELPPLGRVFLPGKKQVHEILLEMVEHLRDQGYLNREVTSSGGLRAEEPDDLN